MKLIIQTEITDKGKPKLVNVPTLENLNREGITNAENEFVWIAELKMYKCPFCPCHFSKMFDLLDHVHAFGNLRIDHKRVWNSELKRRKWGYYEAQKWKR